MNTPVRFHTAATRALSRLSTSRANARAGLAADATIAIGLLAAGVHAGARPAATAALAVIAGLFAFSFTEYAVHRWIFHGVAGAFAAGHTHHHDDPASDDALPFFIAPLAMLGLAVLLHAAMPAADAWLAAGGLAAGYALYGIGHTIMHMRRFRTPWLRDWAAPHHIHHAHPECNFGVTSPLWDALLGTRYARRGPPAR